MGHFDLRAVLTALTISAAVITLPFAATDARRVEGKAMIYTPPNVVGGGLKMCQGDPFGAGGTGSTLAVAQADAIRQWRARTPAGYSDWSKAADSSIKCHGIGRLGGAPYFCTAIGYPCQG